MHWKLEMKGTSVIIDPLMLQRKIWGSSGQWPRWHKALRAGVSLPCDLLLLLPHLAGYLYLAAITAWVRLCHSPVQNPPVIPSFIHSKSQDLRRTCKTLDYPRHTFHPPPNTTWMLCDPILLFPSPITQLHSVLPSTPTARFKVMVYLYHWTQVCKLSPSYPYTLKTLYFR